MDHVRGKLATIVVDEFYSYHIPIYIYISEHVMLWVCVCVCLYTCLAINTYVDMCECMCLYRHACRQAGRYDFTCQGICFCPCGYVHMYVYIYIYIHMTIYIYIIVSGYQIKDAIPNRAYCIYKFGSVLYIHNLTSCSVCVEGNILVDPPSPIPFHRSHCNAQMM